MVPPPAASSLLGLYANNSAGHQDPVAFPSALFSLSSFCKKRQEFSPFCIGAFCNGAKHFSFIIIMPVRGTPNNVKTGRKPLGCVHVAALSPFPTLAVSGQGCCPHQLPSGCNVQPLPGGASGTWKSPRPELGLQSPAAGVPGGTQLLSTTPPQQAVGRCPILTSNVGGTRCVVAWR